MPLAPTDHLGPAWFVCTAAVAGPTNYMDMDT